MTPHNPLNDYKKPNDRISNDREDTIAAWIGIGLFIAFLAALIYQLNRVAAWLDTHFFLV